MTAECPNCKEDVSVDAPEVDESIDCPNCSTELIVTDIAPLTLVDTGDDPGAIEDMEYDDDKW